MVIVASARRLSPVLVLGSIAALNALILLAPPLASTDIFSYQFYGRIGQLYGFNPYLAGPHALAGRSALPVHRVEVDTTRPPSTARCSPRSATSWLRCRFPRTCSPTRRSPRSRAWRSWRSCGTAHACAASIRPEAAALVGLNPLIVVYGVGGGHNDLLMLAPMVAGIVLLLQRRGRLGAGSIVLGAAVKVTAGLMLPFALADARGRMSGARRRDVLIGAGVTAALLAVFGVRAVRNRSAAPPGDDREGPEQGQLAEHPRIHRGSSRLRLDRPAGGAGARRGYSPARCAGCCGASGAASSTGSPAAAGRPSPCSSLPRRYSLVHSMADAVGRARTGSAPVAGLDSANSRDRVLPVARLYPSRQARSPDCEPIVTSLEQPPGVTEPTAARTRAGR